MKTKYSIGKKLDDQYEVVEVRVAKDTDGLCLMYTLSTGNLVSFDKDGNIYEVLDFNIVIN